jgi:trehalose-6-phosphate synthase
MDAQFPLLAFEKDDNSMHLIETPERVLSHLEAIDIENDEYLFWDSTGASVSIFVVRGEVKQIAHCEQGMSLQEALETYAKAYGLHIIAGESAIDTWKALQSQLPPRKTLWERLFGQPKS